MANPKKTRRSPPQGGSSLLTVRSVALALSGVEECSSYGRPAFKVRGKILACLPGHRSAEAGSLVVAVDRDGRATLLADDPEAYYVTEHYAGHPFVLVRLSRVDPDDLRALLGMAHEFILRAPRSRRRE